MTARSGDMKADFAPLILRLFAGGLLIYGHGWGKLVNFGERAASFPDPIGLGPTLGFTLVVFAEVACSTLVILGLFTRFATVPPLVFFAVAAFVQHAHDPFPKRELPLLYLAVFAAVALFGPGRFSIDGLRGRA